MIILDFSKAFDRVPHLPLLTKIHHFGFKGPTYNWIRSFLKDRNQQVVVDGATSDKVQVVSGVPQGTVLGPLLLSDVYQRPARYCHFKHEAPCR